MKKNYLRIIVFLLSLFVGILSAWSYILLSESLSRVAIYSNVISYVHLSKYINYIYLCILCSLSMITINLCRNRRSEK